MTVLIIEDEELAAERLAGMLLKMDSLIEIVSVIDSVEDSILWLKENTAPDLIFMDIMLADGNSFEIFDEVDITSFIIFTTAYNDYAIKAFKVNSIDYLLKPIEADLLANALTKFKMLSPAKSETGEIAKILYDLQKGSKSPPRDYKERFLVKTGNKLIPIVVSDINYFSYENKLTFLYNNKGMRYMLENRLEELDLMLDPNNFFRLNRQFITSFYAVKTVHNYFNSKLKVFLNDGPLDGIIVSRYRANLLKEWLNK